MKKILSFTLLFLACFMFSIAEANLLSNGSFESSSINPGSFTTLSPFSNAITDWTVWSGSIDYIGSYWAAADGGRSIDLNGNEAGSILTYFTTIPGEQYQVDFYMGGNTAGSPGVKSLDLRAYYNGLNFFIDNQIFTFDTTGKSLTSMGWQLQSFIFTAPSNNATILFGSIIAGAYGPAIDNVTVSRVSSVPEPATMLLLGLGLVGLAGISRKKFKR